MTQNSLPRSGIGSNSPEARRSKLKEVAQKANDGYRAEIFTLEIPGSDRPKNLA